MNMNYCQNLNSLIKETSILKVNNMSKETTVFHRVLERCNSFP